MLEELVGEPPDQSRQTVSVPLWDIDDFQSAAAAPQPSGKLLKSIASLGDGLKDDANSRMISRLDGIRTASALNSAFHSFTGGSLCRAGDGGEISGGSQPRWRDGRSANPAVLPF